MPNVLTGLENWIEQSHALPEGRWGLLMNQASITSSMEYASDAFLKRFPGRLTALFSPQHGIFGEQQANMIESEHGFDARLGIPVFSLYSETRRPTSSMLDHIDALFIDLQDVGTRVYTFIWTLMECLIACEARNLPVIVLDRPNPIGGMVAEGPMLESDLKSFVGGFEIPLRHGLTMGEMARFLHRQHGLQLPLTIIPMKGWNRSMVFPETGLPWVPPSPNMPRFETTIFYPGQVLLEGICLSEGRGTTLPFEMIGAPFIDPFALAEALRTFDLPGMWIRPIRFKPTFDKWKGESCGGVSFHVRDPQAIRSVDLTVAAIACCKELYGDQVSWLPPPYEYEYHKSPIDILYGNSQLRHAIDSSQHPMHAIRSIPPWNSDAWWETVQPDLLYGTSDR